MAKEVTPEEYAESLSEFAVMALEIAQRQTVEQRAQSEGLAQQILNILAGTTGGVATSAVAAIAVTIARKHAKFSEELNRARAGQVA